MASGRALRSKQGAPCPWRPDVQLLTVEEGSQVRPVLPTIILIGFMGAGKTSVGQLVARALGREFVDTDLLVQRQARMDINEIFQHEGEEGFRRREAAAIDRAIAIPGRVVAVGGGAVLSAENRTALKQAGLLVYLRATPETLAGRLVGATDRPLLDSGDRVGRIRDLLVARGPIYETAGDLVVDTDRQSPEQSAGEVLEWYRRRVDELAGRV
jgi:shikimate kinase